MSRFGGRAMTVLAVWLGMAMLGFGSRASASFLPFVTDSQFTARAENDCAGGGSSDFQDCSDSPQKLEAVQGLLACDCGMQHSSGGGAGSSSSTSNGPTSPLVILCSQIDVAGAIIRTRLRSLEHFLIPDSHISAILDPPRRLLTFATGHTSALELKLPVGFLVQFDCVLQAASGRTP